MSSTSEGNGHEKRFVAMLTRNLGYDLVAKAKRTPIYVKGKVVGGGDSDLVFGTIDSMFFRRDERVLLVQVTTLSGLSERRAKLREALPRMPRNHVDVLLAGWDKDEQVFRLFRPDTDFLDDHKWRLGPRDTRWPWEPSMETTRQVTLA